MVTNVTSLLKTVKAVEDEATRGTRALEATIECIKQELSVRTGVAPEHGWKLTSNSAASVSPRITSDRLKNNILAESRKLIRP